MLSELQRTSPVTLGDLKLFFESALAISESEVELLVDAFKHLLKSDYSAFIHLAAPRAEANIVNLAKKIGVTPTKRRANRTTRINLDDALSSNQLVKLVGPDIIRWLKFLLSDERHGKNLRNAVSHGLISRDELGDENAFRLAHVLLYLGCLRFRESAE
ncbi:MAG: DUF4209 domain-containing protein [Chloroflexi bacterium]|nr:DUF4209 domain-containing protein [Chloroflexota bacterium]